MWKRRLAVVSIALATASVSSASFIVNYNLASTAGGFYRWDITMTNTGGATGTQIKAMEFTLRSWSGTAPVFQVDDLTDASGTGDPDGMPDTVNFLSASRTRIWVSSTGANNVFVGVNPNNGPIQPNPYVSGANTISGAVANTGTTQATGTGFQIARIYMPAPGSGLRSPFNGFDFFGYVGGDKGPKVPFSIHSAASIVIGLAPDVHVDFGSSSTNEEAFSLFVSVNSVFGSVPPYSLSAVNVPAGAKIDSIVPPANQFEPFKINGRASRSLIGSSVVVPLEASGQGGFGTGYFMLVVTPEPSSLATVSLLASLTLRRCRRSRAGL